MGYYSDIEIQCDNTDVLTLEDKKILREELLGIAERGAIEYFIDNGYMCIDNIKWGCLYKDLQKVFKQLPKLKIEVIVKGEDREDIRSAFFYDGKCEEISANITIIYPETTLW